MMHKFVVAVVAFLLSGFAPNPPYTPAAGYVSADSGATWGALTGSGSSNPLSFVPQKSALYYSNDGTGNPGTWVPWNGVGAGGSGVTSFNSRTGAVSPASADYTAAQVTNALDLSNTATQTMQGNLLLASGKSVSTGIIRDTAGTAAIAIASGKATFSSGYGTTPATITFSATPAITTASLQTITLTGNATPTVTIASGEHLVLQICQDGVGSHTWAPPATMHGAITSANIAAMAINTCAIQAFDSFNGTTLVAENAGVTGVAP